MYRMELTSAVRSLSEGRWHQKSAEWAEGAPFCLSNNYRGACMVNCQAKQEKGSVGFQAQIVASIFF
jgi:hypothetical protein